MNNNGKDLDILKLLWDKWEHHDSLCYQRLTTFWISQGLMGAIIALIWQTDFTNFVKLITTTCILILFGISGTNFWRIMIIDQNVRNTFNKAIVDLLTTNTVLFNGLDETSWDKDNWNPSEVNHPINRWHTPKPFDKKDKFLASRLAKGLVALISI